MATQRHDLYILLKSDTSNSSLSQGVKHLLCEVGAVESGDLERRKSLEMSSSFFDPNGLVQFDEIQKSLPSVSDLESLRECYEESVFMLAQTFKQSEDILGNLSCEDFVEKYDRYFKWTKNSKLFQECFELLTHRNGTDDLLSLLILCGGLERALGNLFLLKSSQCPALLKDLLVTQELEEILGSAAIKLLHIVIGPPISMNIRNVSWHGFLREDELPRRYIFFLLLVTASLGKLIEERGISLDDLKSLDYVPLSKADKICEGLEISEIDVATHKDVILNSWLVQEGSLHLYKSAFSFYQHQRIGCSVIMMLPLLEHALRRLFVVANNCPERLVTAEATTLYTTFEEILDSTLPDGSENLLIKVLEEPFMDLLHDLLIYPNGPRVRDKLSHGEADFKTVPQSVAVTLFVVFRYLAETIQDITAGNSQETSCISHYTSIFHPVAMLHQKLISLSIHPRLLCSDLQYTPELQPWNMAKGFEVLLHNNDVFYDTQGTLSTFLGNIGASKLPKIVEPYQDIEQDIRSMLPPKIQTLHRWQTQKDSAPCNTKITESEVVGLLSRILSEVETGASQTKSALIVRQDQLINKQLRSRQRDNMKRLLAFLPCVSNFMQYIITLCSWIFCHLEDYNRLDEAAQKVLQKFLKSTLRTSENVRSFTSAESNKWSQAGELILVELKSAEKFSQRNIFSP